MDYSSINEVEEAISELEIYEQEDGVYTDDWGEDDEQLIAELRDVVENYEEIIPEYDFRSYCMETVNDLYGDFPVSWVDWDTVETDMSIDWYGIEIDGTYYYAR